MQESQVDERRRLERVEKRSDMSINHRQVIRDNGRIPASTRQSSVQRPRSRRRKLQKKWQAGAPTESLCRRPDPPRACSANSGINHSSRWKRTHELTL